MKPDVVLAHKENDQNRAIEAITDAIMASPGLPHLVAQMALVGFATQNMGLTERTHFFASLSATVSIFDLRERQAEVNRLIYDAAHEASFDMTVETAALVMDLLKAVPDPYPVGEMWDSPELMAAIDRVDANVAAGRTTPMEEWLAASRQRA